MATKSVRFFYYRPYISIDKKACAEWSKNHVFKRNEGQEIIKSLMESEEDIIFQDFEDIIESLIADEVKPLQKVKGKTAEVDLNALQKRENIRMFQITNFRDTNMPSKKKPGKKREDIPLEEDEFIGEFMSVLYHGELKSFMVQSNQYALSKRQLEEFFLLLLLSFYSFDSEVVSFMSFELRAIIDNKMLTKIENKGIVDKLTIKGSDTHLSAITNDTKDALYNMQNILNSFAGVDFEITVRATVNKKTKKVDGLNKKPILEMLKKYINTKKTNAVLPSVITRYREDVESPASEIDWLLPRMITSIRFTVEPKTTLGYEYVFNEMHKEFKENVENKLFSICIGN